MPPIRSLRVRMPSIRTPIRPLRVPPLPPLRTIIPAAAGSLALSATGCGSSSPPRTTASQASRGSAHTTSSAAPTPGALSAEATSAATGDIPDTQVFLVFSSRSAGFSIKYPEGWTQKASAGTVTFSDKNNVVRVVIGHGAAPTAAAVAAQLEALRAAQPSLTFTAPKPITLPAGTALKATYTTESQPNPVTGKRVTLVVDRYVLSDGSRVATVDLGTPVGVDNVDAYRMMIQSFRWR